MPDELKNISKNVMGEIHKRNLKMRPRIYFIVSSLLIFIGFISSILSSVFLFGLIRFSLRTHGPMGEYRLAQILSNIPWWAVVLAVFSLTIGIWLFRRYDFSYKVNFKLIIIGFIVAALVAGYLVDLSGINDLFYGRGYRNRIYQQNKDLNLIQGNAHY